ncbi:peptidase [Pseudoscourfieldia marina]
MSSALARLARLARTVSLGATAFAAGHANGAMEALDDPFEFQRNALAAALGGTKPPDVLSHGSPTRLRVESVGARVLHAMRLMASEELKDATADAKAEGEAAETDAQQVCRKFLAKRGWEFVVIDHPDLNAFVMPAVPNKVFVMRGLAEAIEDDAHLAFILGHELSHALLQHGREKTTAVGLAAVAQLSLLSLVDPLGVFTEPLMYGAMALAATLGVSLPVSRDHERQADALGMKVAARACFHPSTAIGALDALNVALARRQGDEGGGGGLSIFSTHPSTSDRMFHLKTPAIKQDAEDAFDKSGCAQKTRRLWTSIMSTRRRKTSAS